MRNERTSKRVAKIAAKVLAAKIPAKTPASRKYKTGLTWRDIRALAASALTQTPDRVLKELIETAENLLTPNQQRKLAGKKPLPVYDDLGFDPRDGGKVGRQNVPKRKRVLSARIKSKRPSSWPPSAKPPRRSP